MRPGRSRGWGPAEAGRDPQPCCAPRAARVCRRWHEAASHPALWHTVTLAPPPPGRAAQSGVKTEKKLLAALQWLVPNR